MSAADLPMRSRSFALAGSEAGGMARAWFAATCLVILAAMWFIDHDFAVMGRWDEQIGHSVENAVEIRGSAWGAGELSRRFAFPAAAVWGVLLFWFSPRSRGLSWHSMLAWLLVAYVAWCLSSFMWSDQPMTTIKRLVTFFCLAVASIGIGTSLSPRQLCLAATISTTLLSLVSVLGELAMGAFRPWVNEYRLSGALHPNYMAAYLSFACIGSFCLWQYGKRAPWWAANAMLMLGLTALTKSRMALAALLVSLLVVYVGRRSLAGLALAATLLISAAATVMLFVGVTNRATHRSMYEVVVMNRDDEVGSLTGRTPLWKEVGSYFADRPVFGYGYSGFWTIERYANIAKEIGWPASHVHSAYFGAALELGAVGALLWTAVGLLAALIAALRFRRAPDPGYAFLLGISILVLLVSGTETMYFMLNGLALIHSAGLVMLAMPERETQLS